MQMKKFTALALAVLTMLTAAACTAGTTGSSGESVLTPGIVINEVMSSNKYALETADGSSPDWVELKNVSDQPIDLTGYGLSDKTDEPDKFVFPETILEPGEILLIYATGQTETDAEDGIYRAGFKISSDGDDVVLTNTEGSVVQLLDVPALERDISYGLNENNEYVYYATATPGEENAGQWSATGQFQEVEVTTDLKINEYMAENKYSLMDGDGDRSDWVEIRNDGTEAIDLTGYYLTDDPEDPRKWPMPGVSLEGGQLMLIWLSGKDKNIDGEYHASFALGTEDTKLLLVNENGQTVDEIDIEHLDGGMSKGRNVDDHSQWLYYPIPTPGEENTTQSVSSPDDTSYVYPVHISEVKTVSEDSTEGDWIELVNSSSEAVDLSGWGLSDSKSELNRYTFEQGTTLEAGAYLVIEGQLTLSSSGEDVFLTNAEGTIVDRMNTGVQRSTISSGRKDGSGSARFFFEEATKGEANTSQSYETYATNPEFSITGGYTEAGTTVEITCQEGDTIRYTTDGSEPDQSSPVYDGPITINESTSLRAKCFSEGKLNSETVTENYLVEEKHSIPVVCLSIDPYDFSSEEAGIYAKGAGYYQEDNDGSDYAHTLANYWQDWERAINFEYFEADGTKGVSFNAGIKIFGQFSRELDQKSFAIFLRGKYGQTSVTYPFFRGNDVTTFSSFLLRQSGQDCNNTKLKDAFIHQSVKDVMELDVMDYRPVAVYINGEYWGLYNMREKENEDYVVSHHPEAEKGKMDIIKGNTNAQAGDTEEWLALRQYIKTHDMSTLEAQEYVESQINMDSVMEWIIVETFYSNTDTGNVRRYKYEGGKWTWMLFDLDWALTDGYKLYNRLELIFNEAGHGTGNNFYTHIQQAILKNNNWRQRFYELYTYHMNYTFSNERLGTLWDAMVAEIDSEMERQCERWGSPSSYEKWKENCATFRERLMDKNQVARDQYEEYFGQEIPTE